MTTSAPIRTTSALAAAAMALTIPANATLLVYEPFDYTPDEILTGKGSALGTIGTWNSHDTITGAGKTQDWFVHAEGTTSGVGLSDANPSMEPSGMHRWDGTVANLPTSGGYAGLWGADDWTDPDGPHSGEPGRNLDANIELDPSVTATFQSGTTTWFSYVAVRGWDRNEEAPNLILGSEPTPNESRAFTLIDSGNGIGTGGGPPRDVRTFFYPMHYRDGKAHTIYGAVSGDNDPDRIPPTDGRVAWQELNDDSYFGAVNIVVGKIQWDADTAGEDIISVARFLETDTLDEAAFDAQIAASPNLSSANWADAANKPNPDQSTFDILSISGLKFFVDEVRIGTTFEDIISGGVVPPPLFQLTVTPDDTDLDFEWPSKNDKFYNLYSSTNLTLPLANWTLEQGNIAATPATNMKTIPKPGVTTFYYLEEFVPLPLLDVDFEDGNDGFAVKSGGTGSLWTRGAPDSEGIGGAVGTGAGDPPSAGCWGTNLGAYADGTGNPGFYDITPVPTDTCLRSPVIDLTSAPAAKLTFWQALDIDGGDKAQINVIDATTDAIIASDIFPITDSDDFNALWEEIGPIDLPVGQSIRIEWRLQGYTEGYLGWYIDNVNVTLATP